MSVAAALLAGAGIGLGLVLLARAFRPGPVPLATALADLQRPRTPHRSAPPRAFTGGLGRSVTRLLDTTGLLDTVEVGRRLRILDVTLERHVFAKVTLGLTGLVLPIVVAAMLWAGGVTISPAVIGLASLGLGVVGFVWPDAGLAERVERRRQAFRHALSAYLDLVTIILAGGGGLETALQTAADSGDGWAFAEIRHALHRARVTGRTPWDVFADLGAELGIDELAELAASAHLAGNQGARIRASLAAKADTMRAHHTAAIEAEAEAATEKMLLPVVALVVGMILFIGFGVVEAISTPDPTTLNPP